jgi:hypothetical protein
VLQQSFALVPVQAGETVVPRLSIPWWNTETDELEEAVLPASTYQITGAEAVVATPDINEADNANGTARSSDSGDGETQSVSGWIWSTLAFALLWLATLALWWRSRGKKASRPQTPRQQSHSEKQACCCDGHGFSTRDMHLPALRILPGIFMTVNWRLPWKTIRKRFFQPGAVRVK